MSLPNRRVVITGIGVVTSIGMDAASFWNGLVEGRCGIQTIKAFDPSPLQSRIAGEINDFNPKNYISSKEGRKQIRVMARSIQLAVAASQLALDNGKVDKDKL